MNLKVMTIKTPTGTLLVQEKDDSQYPGVVVSFTGNNKVSDEDTVAVIEFVPDKNAIQTVLYKPEQDEPESITVFGQEDK